MPETPSKTQDNESNQSNSFPQHVQIFLSAYCENVKKGFTAGVCASLINYPGDRIVFFAQTIKIAGTYGTSYDFFRNLYHKKFSQAWNNSLYVNATRTYFRTPFNGLNWTLFNSSIKNAFLFPTNALLMWCFNQLDSKNEKRNTVLSGFFAGLTTAYLMRYLSTAKFRAYNGELFKDIINLNSEQLGVGFRATALRDGLYYGTYFHLLMILTENNVLSNSTLNGLISGAIGAFVSNPCSVIAVNQKIAHAPIDFFKMGHKLYKEGGIPRFFNGFGFTLFRMSIQGAVVSTVIDHFQRDKEPCEEDDKNSKLSRDHSPSSAPARRI